MSASSDQVDIDELLGREKNLGDMPSTGNEVSQPEQRQKRKEERAQRKRNSNASLMESTGFKVTIFTILAIVVAVLVFVALLFGSGMNNVLFGPSSQKQKPVSQEQQDESNLQSEEIEELEQPELAEPILEP